ncbi:UNVERIFIED_CONTAM: hypothetical protein Sradi_2963400 [Sesamum radiatum]|uniref:Endonuclease/exonuclease/phosphatase n=1 Tax=Sesamum radiatum TaxID=300843 RepID=A0AAW2S1R7_SESRA
MREFRLALDKARLFDLGCSGDQLTWCNRQEAPHTIYECLDRACGNAKWRLLFPNSDVRLLSSIYSDHAPILIELSPGVVNTNQFARPFHFEASWIKQHDCEELIKKAWNMGIGSTGQERLQQNRDICRSKFVARKQMGCGTVTKEIKEFELRIAQLRNRPLTSDIKLQEKKLRTKLEELFQAEEILWKQRAKAHWLKEGDRNTHFFHSKASGTFQRN